MDAIFYEPNRSVSLATKHEKEKVIRLPFKAGLGLNVIVPAEIETDALGTFSGEIERCGTPREVLTRKARLGMSLTRLSLGIASEGTFAPHPSMPFAAADHEIMIFIDDERGFELVEQIISYNVKALQEKFSYFDDVPDFLRRTDFPRHAVIVRPENRTDLIFKGLQTLNTVREAFNVCGEVSKSGTVQIETDLRAHLNPTRMKVIRKLAIKLVRRLRNACPDCRAPGFGIVAHEKGLPCQWCNSPTELVRTEIFGCAVCNFKEEKSNLTQQDFADPRYCNFCNP